MTSYLSDKGGGGERGEVRYRRVRDRVASRVEGGGGSGMENGGGG